MAPSIIFAPTITQAKNPCSEDYYAHNPQLLITSKVIFSNGKRKRGMEAAKVVINDMALELLMARCLPHSGNPLLKIS